MRVPRATQQDDATRRLWYEGHRGWIIASATSSAVAPLLGEASWPFGALPLPLPSWAILTMLVAGVALSVLLGAYLDGQRQRRTLEEAPVFCDVGEQEYRVTFKVENNTTQATIMSRTPTGWRHLGQRSYPLSWRPGAEDLRYSHIHRKSPKQLLAERALLDVIGKENFYHG